MKYVIIGFPKSAQMSLVKYLQSKGHEAEKFDKIWHEDALELIQGKYDKSWQAIVVMRDIIHRMWSGFIYWKYYQKMNFEKYTHYYAHSRTLGEENPIIQSDYARWLDRVKSLNPLIADFVDLTDIPDFPHENKTEFDIPLPHEKFIFYSKDVVIQKFKQDLADYLNKNNFKRLHIGND